jgi:DNA-directed RNA polymerase specialized sigma24 family protein
MDESLRSVSVLFELQLAALRELAIGLPLGTAKSRLHRARCSQQGRASMDTASVEKVEV